jgi:methionine sulfoxide reductase heme-binding subunit
VNTISATPTNWRRLDVTAVTKVKVLLWLLCLLPLARLVIGAFTDQLGTHPIELITRSTGTWTLVFLCCTLAVTPLRVMTQANWMAQLRRPIGLFAFFYALLHMSTWVWFDQWFDVSAMIKDVIKRPFITVGMLSVILLTPLALTSTKAMMKKLGRNWMRLHQLVYVVACLGVLHYYWLVKRDVTQPVIYGVIVAGLLGWRIWRSRRNK